MSRSAVLQSPDPQSPLIAPSMLKCDFGNLQREVALLEAAGAQLLHWDVMDGRFVGNLSYGAMVIEAVRPLTDLPFDAHLMIAEPARYLDGFLRAGCDAITFHIEAEREPRPLLKRIRDAGALAGVALNPGTPIEAITPFLPECDLVLVMSVEPGFGGQRFIPAAFEKLRRLKPLLRAGTRLSIDGGVDATTIGPSSAAGADLFVVGSAIFDAADYSAAVRNLSAAARNGFA
jgi:ribulose-phosphate 3-epimerase